MITLERIKNIAEDIIADDEWVNDSHTKAEHSGVKAGLYALIHHLEEITNDTWFINEAIISRYDSLCMVFIFIKIRN